VKKIDVEDRLHQTCAVVVHVLILIIKKEDILEIENLAILLEEKRKFISKKVEIKEIKIKEIIKIQENKKKKEKIEKIEKMEKNINAKEISKKRKSL
jgi:hypothetical protein